MGNELLHTPWAWIINSVALTTFIWSMVRWTLFANRHDKSKLKYTAIGFSLSLAGYAMASFATIHFTLRIVENIGKMNMPPGIWVAVPIVLLIAVCILSPPSIGLLIAKRRHKREKSADLIDAIGEQQSP